MMVIIDDKIIDYILDTFVMIRISAMVKAYVSLCFPQMFSLNNIDAKTK